MSIAKFDLYNSEWLEIVFDDRNKMYGAYDLRKHYAANLVKAMGISFFSVALLYTGYEVLKTKPVAYIYKPTETVVTLIQTETVHPPVAPPKQMVNQTHQQVSTVKYPIFKVTEDEKAEEPPKLIDLQTSAVSTTTSKGKDEGVNVDIPETGPGSDGIGKITESTDAPVDMHAVEIEPQPYGGADGWSKFLQKNLRYPPVAVENNIQGKVFLSFIVEKDGKLSNIEIVRGVGSGLNEEATRVLKIAPAWKPGIQNGHPVRVKYTIPINFQLADPNN